MNNPYLNRMAITNPAEFYGRKREMRRIYSRLSTTRPQCLSIIGERKIGKSSLLHFLSDGNNVKKYLQTSEEYIFVLVDLQGKADLNLAGFFDILFDEIDAKVNGLPALEVDDANEMSTFYDNFRDLIRSLGQQGMKLILMLDEFESIARNAGFDLPFFSFLRSIANNNDVAYVTTSRQDLQKISYHQKVRESPFFNIFTPIPLGGFEESEASQLIQEPSQAAGAPFGAEETEFILDLAGNHPLFLQIACDKTFDQKDGTHKLTKASCDSIRSAFFAEAGTHFDYIWENATPDEQDVFVRIVGREEIAPARQYVLGALERRGYVTRVDGRVWLFSSGFEDYVWGKSPRASERRPPSARRRNRSFSLSQPSAFDKFRNLFRRK